MKETSYFQGRLTRVLAPLLGVMGAGAVTGWLACSTPRNDVLVPEGAAGGASGGGSSAAGGSRGGIRTGSGDPAGATSSGGGAGGGAGGGSVGAPSAENAGGSVGGGGGQGSVDAPHEVPARAIPDPFEPVDGDRLKARWAEAEGGARVFAGWYDSQRHANCIIYRTLDGDLHCMPLGSYQSRGYFLDAACGVAAAVSSLPPGCPVPDVVSTAIPTTPARCESRYRFNQLGAPVTSGMLYYRSPFASNPTCTTRGTTQITAGRVFEVGPELPPSMFVKFTPRTLPPLPSNPRIDLMIYEGDDGSLSAGAWFNVASKTTCGYFLASDGNYRCLDGPTASASDSNYDLGDAGCKQPTASFRPACAAPQIVSYYTSHSCPAKNTLNALGPPVAQTYYKDDAGKCTASISDPASGLEYHMVGAPIPIDGFPVVGYTLDPSTSGRLRRRLFSTPGGRSSTLGGWFDTTLNQPCSMTQLTSGSTRCLPSTDYVSNEYFSDAACTALVLETDAGACAPKYALKSAACNSSSYSLYNVGARYTGKLYYLSAGTCTDTTPSFGYVYYLLTAGFESSFAMLTMREPK